MADVKIITINELIKAFNDFADAHLMLKDFGYGQVSDISTSRQMLLPYMWVTHTTTSNIEVANRTSIPTLSMTFIFADQVNIQENFEDVNGADSNNTQEIISDMHQVLQDFIVYITSELTTFGAKITDDLITYEPMFDETTDKVAGIVATINIKLIHSNCQYPTEGIAPVIPIICTNGLFLKGVFASDNDTMETLTIDADNAGTYTSITDDGSSGDITLDINGGGDNAFINPTVLGIGDTLLVKRTITTANGFYKITGTFS